jgi:hypothetical protein
MISSDQISGGKIANIIVLNDKKTWLLKNLFLCDLKKNCRGMSPAPRGISFLKISSRIDDRARDIDLSMGERECSALFLEEIGGWEMAAKK